MTTISVQTFIDHGARRCGKLAEELTSEQLLSARESLHFLLSELINIGIQYWAIDKTVIGLKPERYQYPMPLGANDVLNVLYRTMDRPTGNYATSAGGNVGFVGDNDVDTYCQQVSTNGNISVNYGSGNSLYIGSIGILPYIAGGGGAVWNLVLEYSVDGFTWNTLKDLGAVAVTDNEWVWSDIDPGASAIAYRVRATGGTTLALREFYLGNNSREIPMSRLNRDDYTSIPNKNFTANQPYQFWFNRTIPQPQINLWPTPSNPFVQVVAWYSRQVKDVGDLTDTLDIPQRWYMAIQAKLSHQMSLELPQVPLDRIQYLEGQAEKHLSIAEQEERDKSPIYLAPNISVYTR